MKSLAGLSIGLVSFLLGASAAFAETEISDGYLKGTLITMANGSVKKIEKLVPGDILRNPYTRGSAPLKKLLSGHAVVGELVHTLVTPEGMVAVTSGLQLFTGFGVQEAREISVNDFLFANSFWSVPVLSTEIKVITRSVQVYHVQLDVTSNRTQDHLVLAGGIVGGDYVLDQ